jgi:hypothetical protein
LQDFRADGEAGGAEGEGQVQDETAVGSVEGKVECCL